MTHIFDGREFAKRREEILREKVTNLLPSAKPKLVSIIVGNDPASILYQGLKKKAAERIGAVVEIKLLSSSESVDALVKLIDELNNDPSVNGIMIQLPLPKRFSKEDRDKIIEVISPEKDVDGLKVDSKFTPPTAKAVLQILEEALKVRPLKDSPCKITVVGGSGFIGKQIVRTLNKEFVNTRIKELKLGVVNSKTKNLRLMTKDSDVLITVTGVEDLIKEDMVKKDSVLIDVGAPKGDISKEAYKKASFVSPVPGGVGPVTIFSLLENLVLKDEAS